MATDNNWESKGTDLQSLNDWIVDTFGEEGFQRWYQTLSPRAQEIHEIGGRARIFPSAWYPTVEGLLEPLEVACDQFFDGDVKRGCWAQGIAAAEYSFTGVYRKVLWYGPAKLMITQAPKILSMFLRPGTIKTSDVTQTSAVLEFHDTPSRLSFDYQNGGFAEQLLRMSGKTPAGVEVVQSAAEGNDYSSILLKWVEPTIW